MRSHDCYLKRCVKNSLTQYSFYVMKSRVSSNCTRNICPLQSIVYDQMEEASFMGLTAATIMATIEGHRARQI